MYKTLIQIKESQEEANLIKLDYIARKRLAFENTS